MGLLLPPYWVVGVGSVVVEAIVWSGFRDYVCVRYQLVLKQIGGTVEREFGGWKWKIGRIELLRVLMR